MGARKFGTQSTLLQKGENCVYFDSNLKVRGSKESYCGFVPEYFVKAIPVDNLIGKL